VKKELKLITDRFFEEFQNNINFDIEKAFVDLKQKDWTIENFQFYTAVSVMASSRIEGETLEIDSYLKHKIQEIEYLPNLTEKPNDLFSAYEFARDNKLNYINFQEAHKIATKHLLPENQRGIVRSGNMLILDQETGQIQYEAAFSSIVKREYDLFWQELDYLIREKLSNEHIFYFASLIHLIFVKIHPFNDGNGRTARLLEKWFLASHLGENAWYIGSEFYYYKNLQDYYKNLARVGLFYDSLDYQKSIPFLQMLPNALLNDKK
jgi:Fic family protein